MKKAGIVIAVAIVAIALLVLADLSSEHSRILAALTQGEPEAQPDPQEEAA